LAARVAPLRALVANATEGYVATNQVITIGTPGFTVQNYLWGYRTNALSFYNPWIAGLISKKIDVTLGPTHKLKVKRLGLFDWGGDGIRSPNNCTMLWSDPQICIPFLKICRSDGTEVVPPVYFSGTSDPLDPSGLFRMKSVSEVELTSGTYYLIGRGGSYYNINGPGGPFKPCIDGVGPSGYNGCGEFYSDDGGGMMTLRISASPTDTYYKATNLPDYVSCDVVTYAGPTTTPFFGTVEYEFIDSGSSELINQPGLVSTNILFVAENISKRIMTGSPYSALPAYGTPGEICEVNGIGLAVSPNKFERQKLIRRIGNLITTRSNAFNFWGMSQLVKDIDADGKFDWNYYVKSLWLPLDAKPGYSGNGLPLANVISRIDGDGDGNQPDDRILSTVKLNAILERYVDTADANKPKVRVVNLRYYEIED
jgi:hypothetical protein